MAATVAGLLKVLCDAGGADELDVRRLNAGLSAGDLARVVRMNFGNDLVGSVTPALVWE
jgi:hypothetical protein